MTDRHHIHIWLMPPDRIADYLDHLPEGLISRNSWDRAARCHFEADRISFLASCCLQRLAAARYFQLEPEKVDIIHTDQEKPLINGPGDRISQISVSRRRNLIAVAVADTPSLGVDVEVEAEPEEAVELLRPFLSNSSHEFAINSIIEGKGAAFAQFWTLIEACGKAAGEGLNAFQSDLVLKKISHDQYALKTPGGSWSGQVLPAQQGCAVSLVWSGSDICPHIHYHDGGDLFHRRKSIA